MIVICPYCNCPTYLTDSKAVYGRSYGPIYLCLICGAYVGCHPGSITPLGVPANKALRTARRMAHSAFDPIWKSGKMTRSEAYKWLAGHMGLPQAQTHIGMFNLDQCCRVLRICTKGGEPPVD